MKLNFTQKAYLSGTLFYIVLITIVLSVFEPTSSIKTSISREKRMDKVIVEDTNYASDTEMNINNESIIPFLATPIEVCFNKINQKGVNTFTKL